MDKNCHDCCPAEWRSTPNMTGSYELDGVLARNTNGDVPHRLAYYLDRPTNSYGPRTAYNGYRGYSGDD